MIIGLGRGLSAWMMFEDQDVSYCDQSAMNRLCSMDRQECLSYNQKKKKPSHTLTAYSSVCVHAPVCCKHCIFLSIYRKYELMVLLVAHLATGQLRYCFFFIYYFLVLFLAEILAHKVHQVSLALPDMVVSVARSLRYLR